MTDLPSGWALVPYKDLGDWYGGGTPSKANPTYWADGTIPWLSPKDMGADTIGATQDVIHPSAVAETSVRLVPAGSVAVVVRSGILERILPVAYVPFETTLNQDMKALVPRAGILPQWVAWGLRARGNDLLRATRKSGTTVASIEMPRFMQQQMPIPPLDEQRRIVNILEDHLSRLDDAERSILRASKLADQMLLSALVRATSPARHWVETTLGDLACSVRNGIFVSRPSTEPIGIPILRIGAVRSMHLDLTDLRYTGQQVADFNADTQLLKSGDLLFTRYNGNPEYVAACAEVPSLDYEVTYPDKLIRVRLRTDLAHPSFVAMACSAGLTRTFLKSKVKTTAGQAGISGSDVKAAPILLPPLDEQTALAKEFRDFRDQQEAPLASVASVQHMTDGLRRSLLRVAFSCGLNDTREASSVV